LESGDGESKACSDGSSVLEMGQCIRNNIVHTWDVDDLKVDLVFE
jgi:hypothetical protein